MDAVNILFFYSVNVTVGVNEDRQMLTGMHTVADIFCVGCGSIVGWRYVRFVTVLQEYDFFCLYNRIKQLPYWLLSGDCSWKKPEVQGRKICTWTVSRNVVWENIVNIMWSYLKRQVYGELNVFFLLLARYKVSGPDGNNNNNYWVSHEAHVGGSDADDA